MFHLLVLKMFMILDMMCVHKFCLIFFLCNLGDFLSAKKIFMHTEVEFRKKVNLTVAATRCVFIEASKISCAKYK